MRFKLRTGQQRQPIGGHHHRVHGITFRADTVTKLALEIKMYRLSNGLPVGDPEQEILQMYAQNWPFMVVLDGTEQPEEPEDQDYLDWRHWVSTTWKNPSPTLITTKEARQRWEICQNCPMNAPKNWGASEESTEAQKRIYMMRKGLKVPENLGFCRLHRWDISVAVFIDKPAPFSHKKDGESQAGCWH